MFVDSLARGVVPRLARARGFILALSLVLFVVGAVYSVRLYSDLRADIEELLPENAPSYVAAKVLREKLHDVARLVVVVESDNPAAVSRFLGALGPRLERLPPDLVESVTYRTDAEHDFFRRFGPLYVSADDLVTIRDRLRARIKWEKRKTLSLLGPEALEPAPPADFSDIAAKYETFEQSSLRKGYLQSPDGRTGLLELRPPEDGTGLAHDRAVLNAVEREVAALNPQSFDPTLRVGYSGVVCDIVEEQGALVSDIVVSGVLVLVLELAVLWWYFRRLAAVAALLATLAVGCAVTFGLTQLLVGYLNANTAFLGGIVLGNGINPTIVLLARYLEERRRGAPVDGALLNAWSATLPATFVASFAAGLAYLSLASTSFRGFSQFGVIGFLGMASCWLSTYLVLPAIVATLDARGRLAPRPNAGRSGVRLARFVTAHQTGLRAATVGVLLFGVMGAVLRRHDAVEYDWTRLRSRHSQREGTNYWGHRSDRVYEGSIPPVTPVVLWAPSPAELEATLAALERRREALGQQDPIRLVQSIHDAVPPDQGRRIALLDEIRPLLSDAILKHLSPEQRRTALQLRPVTDLRPVTLQDLPHPLQQALVERDGTAGRVALLYPRDLLPTDLRKSRAVSAVVSAAITESGGHTLAYSPLLLLAEIGAATLRDGPHATWVALVLVSLLVVVLMRRPRDIAAVLGSLLMGVAALVGIAAATGQRVNFINFVVLPITFGIGVDYAANVVHRFRTDRAGGLEHALGETGGAIALCSATTIIGYGSLWIADNQALAGFGVLAALGELTCLSAALCLLPAWLTRVRKQPP